MYMGTCRFSEGLATSVLGKSTTIPVFYLHCLSVSDSIAQTRDGVVFTLSDCCWEIMRQIRLQNVCLLRSSHSMGSEVEVCDAVNLECLIREFPGLCAPRTYQPDLRSIIEICDTINKIRHLEEMNGLADRFAERHEACDVGYFLQGSAEDVVNDMRGLKLSQESRFSRLRLPGSMTRLWKFGCLF